jgi:hypothetical protein
MTIFGMKQHHNWSVLDLENMYPFELNIYVDLLKEHLNKIEKENAKHNK